MSESPVPWIISGIWFLAVVAFPGGMPLILALCGMRGVGIWICGALICLVVMVLGGIVFMVPAVQEGDASFCRAAGIATPGPFLSVPIGALCGMLGCLLAGMVPKPDPRR